MYCLVMSKNKNSCVNLQTWRLDQIVSIQPKIAMGIPEKLGQWFHSGQTGIHFFYQQWVVFVGGAPHDTVHIFSERVLSHKHRWWLVFSFQKLSMCYLLWYLSWKLLTLKRIIRYYSILIIHFSWSLFLCRIHLSNFALEDF